MGNTKYDRQRVPESTFADYCITALDRRGDHIAFLHDQRELTGNESVDLARRIATVLRESGLTLGAGIAVLSGNLPEAFLVMVATHIVGGRHTGLAPLGSESDHRFVIEDSRAQILVYDPRSFSSRARELASTPGIDRVFSLGPGPVGEDLLALAELVEPTAGSSAASSDDCASIFYTGGTTGRPKGVVHSHRSALFQALLVQSNWQWPEDIKLLITAPITHAAGQLVAPALALGGHVVLMDKFDAGETLRIVEKHQISVTFLVPTMIYALLDHPDIDRRDLSSMQTLVYGASSISRPRLVEAHERFGSVLMQGYGQTEIGVGCLLLRKEDHQLSRPHLLAAAGRPPAGITAAILDEKGNKVSVGQPGELCLRGTSVMQQYWNQPELTEQVLVDGWLHTGDIATCDGEGYYYIVDRKKDMIVSGGFNVYPKEIEDVLHSHPAVEFAAVVGVPDDKWGESVHALVKISDGAEIEVDDLRSLVRLMKGPIYTPKEIHFTDDFPLTALGKLDKKAIKRRLSP
ncbi:hypothetical protein CH282_15625 [Rhodococcus sp. 06-418-1B]|nr:AMP-binding protein [Rhodococcus sp. 06-418-1B]OZC83391.1 hypothetical protein CH282_15625 [Rhodococcus sp. 06-418-1B]